MSPSSTNLALLRLLALLSKCVLQLISPSLVPCLKTDQGLQVKLRKHPTFSSEHSISHPTVPTLSEVWNRYNYIKLTYFIGFAGICSIFLGALQLEIQTSITVCCKTWHKWRFVLSRKEHFIYLSEQIMHSFKELTGVLFMMLYS